MSASANPDIVDDGLVFLYDTDDGKSYKGEPTENLVPVGDRTLTTVLQRQSWHIAEWTYSLETNINGRADVLKIYINPTGSESSQPYADFGFQAYKSGGSQVGDVYAITFDYYVTKSTNTPSLIVAYANGYKSPTSASAASLGTITTTDLGNGWVRATRIATITTAGNTHWRFGLSSNYNETEVYVDNFQVELKSHATPFVDGTRSATQGLIDRTGNTTIDLSDVSFDSNAQMTFDGTDDYISAASFDMGTPTEITVECVIRFNGSLDSADRKVMHYNKSGGTNAVFQLRKGDSNSRLYYQAHNGSQWYTMTDTDAIESDTWAHFIITHSGTSAIMYKNGVQSATATMGNLEWTNANDLLIGYRTNSEYWKGDIAIMKIYNKALTSTEVLQNYKSTKSRFNL